MGQFWELVLTLDTLVHQLDKAVLSPSPFLQLFWLLGGHLVISGTSLVFLTSLSGAAYHDCLMRVCKVTRPSEQLSGAFSHLFMGSSILLFNLSLSVVDFVSHQHSG